MKNIIIAAVLGATAAFGAAALINEPAVTESHSLSENSASFNADLPLDSRIAALEQAVSVEREARQLLQEEVFFLYAEIEARNASVSSEPPRPVAIEPEQSAESRSDDRRARRARRNSPEGRTERLIEAGFDPGMATWIVQREQELQMEALQARYEAGQSGDPSGYYRSQRSLSGELREELGDGDYERYLEANGRPISVSVSSVIGSSPAQSAGLKPGDEITQYDGNRVFSMTDIHNATMSGEPGQNIVVDIVREGVPMQVVLPRGPLGITGGRTRR